MQYITIDTVVKSVLLRRGYGMHFYLQFLKYGSDCVRELGYSTFRMVKTELLQADEYGQVPLPTDFEKWLRVGVINGQHVRPLVQSTGFFRKLYTDENGVAVPYPQPNFAYQGGWGWMNSWLYNVNEYGESTGGYYGRGMGYEIDLFEIIPERKVLQVSQELAGAYIVLDYLPNVANPNNLCQIPQMAQATVEQYIIWQMKEHKRDYQKGEAKDEERMYYNELRQLRARLQPMSEDDWLRVFRRAYYGTVKA